MKCEEVIDLFIAQKEEDDADSRLAIDRHLRSCDDCRRKVEEINFLMMAIENQPQPDAPVEMNARFAAYMKDQQNEKVQVTIVRKLSRQLWIAAGLILILGLSILFVLIYQNRIQQPSARELVQQNTATENLFSSASASIRIQAITEVDSLSADVDLINTLSRILLTDKNANVRMAALYSLISHLSDPSVYAVFVEALKKEKEPELQVLLINTLAQKSNPKGVEAIQSLVNNSATRSEVRAVAEQTLKTL